MNPDLMDAQISEFLTETIVDIPDDPWSASALDRVEREILDRFGTVSDVAAPANHEIADQITRFLGEVFRRKFEGRWLNVPGMGGKRYPDFGPVIGHEWIDIHLDVANLVTAAVDRQWGDYLSEIFTRNAHGYAEWAKAGRPPMAEWVEN
ncbi:hypothetical protein ACFYXQ_19530 [Nocardia jiangxiensis]|uniref:Uncharacterized protein n=1 Tax=Nocardia jiangxiensis TaxID=282685 RepID=A0ABW6S0Z9_9NOCA